MRSLPNLKIISPCDAHEMKHLMLDSVNVKGPLYVRIARGGEEIITKKFKPKIGKAINLKRAKDYYFLTTGITSHIALKACRILQEKDNIQCGVAHFSTVKPLDKKFLNKIRSSSKNIITVEENVKAGGFGSSILEFSSQMNNREKNADIKIMGLKDKFLDKYGTSKNY